MDKAAANKPKTGRKSKLTDEQWLEIARRRLSGEKVRPLAKEFGVSIAQVSEQCKFRSETIDVVSNQVIEAQIALKTLSIPERNAVNQHVATLLALSEELGCAAIAGAKTSRRIHEAVNRRAEKLNDFELLSEDELKTVAQASTASNLSSKLAADVLNIATRPGASIQQADPEELITMIELVAPGVHGAGA